MESCMSTLFTSNSSTLIDDLQNLIALDTKLTNTCFILCLSANTCCLVRLNEILQSYKMSLFFISL